MKVYKIKELHSDDRGIIADVIPDNAVIKTVLYITGTTGAVRAKHWHKKDEHYCLVLGGKLLYTGKDRKTKKTESVILESGDVVFSPAGELHKFEFLTEGIFIAFSTLGRTQKSYESDTVREEL